ncbi:MAG: hypothetical protein ACRDPT_14355 [Streptomycetales bacterium]
MTRHTYEIRYRGTAAASALSDQVEADRFSDRANFVDFEVREQEEPEAWRTVLRVRHDDVLQIRETS